MELIAGRYRVLRKLGSGGMAEVFLARREADEGVSRQVVIKRSLSRDADAAKMFLDEARIAARLHHDAIAQVFDFGSDTDGYFLVMEYLDGLDARALVKARPGGLTCAHAAAIVARAALGLHHAHEQRDDAGAPLAIVHRDITAGNVFVTIDGGVKVIDFGIARAAARLTRTRTGYTKGTLVYMSPEQLANRGVDHRSDLYSLGVVLYELVVGRRPFDAPGDPELAIMTRIEIGGHTPARAKRGDVPAALDALIEKMIAVDPALRPPSGEAIAEELDAIARTSAPELGRFVRRVRDERDAPARDPLEAPTVRDKPAPAPAPVPVPPPIPKKRTLAIAAAIVVIIVITWTLTRSSTREPGAESPPRADASAGAGAKADVRCSAAKMQLSRVKTQVRVRRVRLERQDLEDKRFVLGACDREVAEYFEEVERLVRAQENAHQLSFVQIDEHGLAVYRDMDSGKILGVGDVDR